MTWRLPSYDTTQIYHARRPMTLGEAIFQQGDAVPRNLVSPDQYRRMFEKRIIVPLAPVDSLPVPAQVADKTRLAPNEDGIYPGSKGWFTIVVGGKSRSVRGEDKAKAAFQEMIDAAIDEPPTGFMAPSLEEESAAAEPEQKFTPLPDGAAEQDAMDQSSGAGGWDTGMGISRGDDEDDTAEDEV